MIESQMKIDTMIESQMKIDITGVPVTAFPMGDAGWPTNPQRQRILRAAVVIREHRPELSPERSMWLAERADFEGRICGG